MGTDPIRSTSESLLGVLDDPESGPAGGRWPAGTIVGHNTPHLQALSIPEQNLAFIPATWLGVNGAQR